MAMTLGAATGTWTRCACGITPLRCSPPRKSVRVVADARKTSHGRMTKKNNAVDVNAASLNSTLHGVEGPRVSNGNVLREEKPEVVEEKNNTPKIPLQEVLMQKLKLDQALDEIVGFMAPREKGDIRDVILMSFSFAVLVYISQRLVCLYCVVRHMYSF